MSYNSELYVYSDPINLTDPSGYNPNCISFFTDICATKRFYEIISENPLTAGQNALTLVALFEDRELQTLWGTYAGRTVARRLEWILTMTSGEKKTGIDLWGLPYQFRVDALFGYNDCWFKGDLQDNQFYGISANGARNPWYNKPYSNQVGHFLTATALSYGQYPDSVTFQFIIGHELLDDDNLSGQLGVDVSTAIPYFLGAVDADAQGNKLKRDQLLWNILGFPGPVNPNYVDPNRQGNSLQDLRLSVKGYRFGKWVYDNSSLLPVDGARWLRRNIVAGRFK